MSIFSEILPKISDISKTFTKNFNDDLKAAFELFDKFGEEVQHGKSRAREKAQKDKDAKITLQSINELEDEPPKKPEIKRNSSNSSSKSSSDSERQSKKRSKNEVDGISSPEQDKRQKRNASVKAQSIISKQVNVNLTQKLRRENSNEKADKNESTQNTRNQKNVEKENLEPNTLPAINNNHTGSGNVDTANFLFVVKQEKISIPPEPEEMETESLPINIDIKTERIKDDIAMPPPAAPGPKGRKGVPKEKPTSTTDSEDESTGKRRTRTKKTEAQPVAAPSTRSSSRLRQTETEEPNQPAPRPKRTRAKKKVSDAAAIDTETTISSQETLPVSPAEKPRPKRTRRAQKAAEKEEKNPEKISSEEEIITQTETISSPILQKEINKNKTIEINTTKCEPSIAITKLTQKELDKYRNDQEIRTNDKILTKSQSAEEVPKNNDTTTKSRIPEKLAKRSNEEMVIISHEEIVKTKPVEKTKNDNALNETHVISNGIEMDKTMVLPNGIYNHAPITPKTIGNMDETIVISRRDQTMVLDKPHNIMNATVIIDKGPKANISEDNSLLTDDSDSLEPQTPTKKQIATQQPSSAVKEKVQQFEEMASRVTRTKTRAMAKKDDEPETQTPPDKLIKNALSTDTLTKMNNMIFNGKPPQISSSASKIQVAPQKPSVSSSASKISYNTMSKAREEEMKREDARKKKEAMLEAKREQQRRKREDKMAAAAAARLLAQHERKLCEQAARRERLERQLQLDMGKVARMKLIERKKLELARKVASTEERRKAEELSRQQRLQEEQKRANELRKKQLLEQEATKREAAIMAKEIEQKQREYIEKQKKQREDKHHTPFKTPSTGIQGRVEPVYMLDGFQFLCSDEEAEPVDRPVPAWSTSQARKAQLVIQSAIKQSHIDRLFSVRAHCPDLSEIFPGIENARLKRTSSAVWRTPPKLPTVEELK